jgi:hypothetical protein
MYIVRDTNLLTLAAYSETGTAGELSRYSIRHQ